MYVESVVFWHTFLCRVFVDRAGFLKILLIEAIESLPNIICQNALKREGNEAFTTRRFKGMLFGSPYEETICATERTFSLSQNKE